MHRPKRLVVISPLVVGVGLLMSVLSSGCRHDAPRTREKSEALPVSGSPGLPCHYGTGEKLGLPFVRVCPRTSPGITAGSAFWISAVPLSCGGGGHEEVRCMPVVPLRLAPEEGGEAPSHIPVVKAALVDAFAGHRLCTMRFAGRLPTRTERAQARDAIGMTTLAVVESSSAPVHFEFRQLPEWVTKEPCDHPSLLGSECGVDRAPAEATPRLDWERTRSCEADAVGPGGALPFVAVGESCPTIGGSGGAGAVAAPFVELPCAVHGLVLDRRESRGFRLTCQRSPASTPAHPSDEALVVAAVRCVVAEALLDAHSG